MCTVCIYLQVDRDWPLMIASNRDEYQGRAWRLPDHHWPHAPDVFGPLDVPSGGAWFGVNRQGLFCALLNQSRTQSLHTDRRSRGELVVAALRADTLAGATAYLTAIDCKQYLPFHIVLATRQAAALASSDGAALSLRDIAPGVHIASSRGLDDPRCDKAGRFLRAFRANIPPDPAAEQWRVFRHQLATPACVHPKDGLWINLGDGYGTRSSAIIGAGDDGWHILHSIPTSTEPPLTYRLYRLAIDP